MASHFFKILTSVLIFLGGASAYGLTFDEVHEYARRGDYLGGLQKSQKALDCARRLKNKNLYSQWNGFFQSYIGNYALAEQRTFAFWPPNKDQFTSEDEGNLIEATTMASALQAIPEVAKKRQILIINENHHVPQHRLLGRMLLDELFAAGFRYFALETLNETHEEFSKRGFLSRRDTNVFVMKG